MAPLRRSMIVRFLVPLVTTSFASGGHVMYVFDGDQGGLDVLDAKRMWPRSYIILLLRPRPHVASFF